VTDVIPIRAVPPEDDAATVLDDAKGQVRDVLVLGYAEDGSLYAAATKHFADGGNLLWLLESLKCELMAGKLVGAE
jgi:hypothetical protein